jgi:hypothetical protein
MDNIEVEKAEIDAYCRARAAEHLAKANPPDKPDFGPIYRQFEEACIAIYTHHPGNVQGADEFARFILRQKRLLAFIRSSNKSDEVTSK